MDTTAAKIRRVLTEGPYVKIGLIEVLPKSFSELVVAYAACNCLDLFYRKNIPSASIHELQRSAATAGNAG
jgi:hypothetical protein